MLTPKSSFLNIFQNFLQHIIFTLFWCPTLHMWNFYSASFCLQGGPRRSRNSKNVMISKKNSTRNCKKNFLIKAKIFEYFCTGCPKSALRGGETKFLKFFLQSLVEFFLDIITFFFWSFGTSWDPPANKMKKVKNFTYGVLGIKILEEGRVELIS